MRHAQAAQVAALVSVLCEPGRTFLVHPRPLFAPILDPSGAALDGYAPTIESIEDGGREFRIEGLPPGYVISGGDFLSFVYGASPTRYALHQAVTVATADGAGLDAQDRSHAPNSAGRCDRRGRGAGAALHQGGSVSADRADFANPHDVGPVARFRPNAGLTRHHSERTFMVRPEKPAPKPQCFIAPLYLPGTPPEDIETAQPEGLVSFMADPEPGVVRMIVNAGDGRVEALMTPTTQLMLARAAIEAGKVAENAPPKPEDADAKPNRKARRAAAN